MFAAEERLRSHLVLPLTPPAPVVGAEPAGTVPWPQAVAHIPGPSRGTIVGAQRSARLTRDTGDADLPGGPPRYSLPSTPNRAGARGWALRRAGAGPSPPPRRTSGVRACRRYDRRQARARGSAAKRTPWTGWLRQRGGDLRLVGRSTQDRPEPASMSAQATRFSRTVSASKPPGSRPKMANPLRKANSQGRSAGSRG